MVSRFFVFSWMFFCCCEGELCWVVIYLFVFVGFVGARCKFLIMFFCYAFVLFCLYLECFFEGG